MNNVNYTLGGETHRVHKFNFYAGDGKTRLSLFHADQTDSSALPLSLFKAVSTDLGVLYTADASPNFITTATTDTGSNGVVTQWIWTANIIPTTNNTKFNFTILE